MENISNINQKMIEMSSSEIIGTLIIPTHTAVDKIIPYVKTICIDKNYNYNSINNFVLYDVNGD